MQFRTFCEYLEKIELTDSRNEMTQLMSEALMSAKDLEVPIFCYLLIGRVAPLFINAEFNLSEKGLMNALETVVRMGELDTDISQMRSELGDTGLVVEKIVEMLIEKHSRSRDSNLQRSRKNSLEAIYDSLWKIIKVEGSGSVGKKADIFIGLVNTMTPLEARYLTRIITGKLRLGVSDRTILDAISFALVGDKGLKDKLSEYYGLMPDIGTIAYSSIVEKISFDDKVFDDLPVVGIPIKSRLVERIKTFPELFERYDDEFYLQPKFDGLRCQVHKGVDFTSKRLEKAAWSEYMKKGGEDSILSMFGSDPTKDEQGDIRLYSRNLEDLTDMFPDIVDEIGRSSDTSMILDCEIVGWDEKKARFTTFQETMKRKRKYDVSKMSKEIPVRLYVFDILYQDERSLLNKPLSERLETLQTAFEQKDLSFIKLAETRKVSDIKQVEEFFEESVAKGLEGLIAKDLEGVYEPGKRSFGWIKLKKSMKKSLVDTIDVVVMGYYKGSGKQATMGIGALLVGIINEEGDVESVSKIGTGITDKQWAEIKDTLDTIVVKSRPKIYKKVDRTLEPDVWVEPAIVSSVEADEITRSKLHSACSTELGHGLALRFPRLIEFARDKSVDEATSTSELIELANIRGAGLG